MNTSMTTASSVVENLLVKLNLNEFPCKSPSDKDEFHQELIKSQHSPWFETNDWSDEILSLKLEAIQTNQSNGKIKKKFKTLILRDKKINTIDDKIKNFVNLELLNLSGNFLEEINLENLPPKIKNLVLCGNRISEVSIKSENNIAHVALSYNQLCSLNFLENANLWNNLMSLDLSHNFLEGLATTVESLSKFPRLKNLCLFGNPLAIARNYKTCVEGMLDLIYFDDEIISNEGKNASRKYITQNKVDDEFTLSLSLSQIRGIPQPREDSVIYQTFSYFAAFCLHTTPSNNSETFISSDGPNEGSDHFLKFDNERFMLYSGKIQNWAPTIDFSWAPKITGTANRQIFHCFNQIPGTLYIIEEKTSYKKDPKDQSSEAPKSKKGPPSPVGAKKKDPKKKTTMNIVDTVERSAVVSVEVPLREVMNSPQNFEFKVVAEVQSDIALTPRAKKGNKVDDKKLKMSKDKINTAIDNIEFDLKVTLNE